MRLVYISSPLRGDMEKNKEKAKDYCAYAASCGVIPLAPHTIFTQYLNDAVPEQREQGLRMGHELLERCDELWVMGDTISQGMKDEIGLATFLQLPILYVSDDMVKNQKMVRQSDRPLDINDCIPDSSQYNYENQFLVLKPGVSSKGKDMTADDSIWYARNGFGCIYGARGQAVYAESLLTGKYIHWERHDFCGIVKPESLKEWLLDMPIMFRTDDGTLISNNEFADIGLFNSKQCVQDGTERILPFTEYESDMVSTWNLEKKAYPDSLLDAFEDEDEQEDELPF